MRFSLSSGWRRRTLTVAAAGALALSGIVLSATAGSAAPTASAAAGRGPDGLGVQPGKIKHVWLIILENKSYDATLHRPEQQHVTCGRRCPRQGVLLKNYYGTGHFSLDNYISMVSGQATQPDTQADCPFYDHVRRQHVEHHGQPATNPNFGQLASAAGPNAAPGTNGCVYPSSVPTLFNQLDAAHVSWKGYAQDLGNPEAGSRAAQRRRQRPAAPRSPTPGPTGSTAAAQPGQRQRRPTSTCPSTSRSRGSTRSCNSGDCNATHIANLFDPANGLFHDLQSTSDDAGVQLDHAEQLQRRARRGLPRQQPVRRLLRPEHAQARRSTSPAACTPLTCSSSTSSRRSRRRPRSRTAA